MKVLFVFFILITQVCYAQNLTPLNTSLSDANLKYERIQPLSFQEDEEDRTDIFEKVYDLLKLHNFIKALNDYDDLCSEMKRAGTLIDKEREMESEIIGKIVEKFKQDRAGDGLSSIDKYREEVSEINLVVKYNTAAKELVDVCTNESELNDLAKDVKDKYLELKGSNNINMSDVCSNLDILFKNFNVARDVLAEAYASATNLPDDVDFFNNTSQEIYLDNDRYQNVPILESTKYIGDICPNNSGEDKFYKIPLVWSKTYPNFWGACWCRLKRGATADPPCCGQTCADAGSLENIKKDGEWDTYLKEPPMAPRRTPGGEEVCTPQSAGTYELVGDKRHFRNRFEDYDRCQLALFRAFENKRNICQVLEVMKEEIKTSYRILKEDENETGMDALTCADIDDKRRELIKEKKQRIAEIQPDIENEDDELHSLFEEISGDELSNYMITNFMVKNGWYKLKVAQKSVNAITTPTEIYMEELETFRDNVEGVWAVIYTDRF